MTSTLYQHAVSSLLQTWILLGVKITAVYNPECQNPVQNLKRFVVLTRMICVQAHRNAACGIAEQLNLKDAYRGTASKHPKVLVAGQTKGVRICLLHQLQVASLISDMSASTLCIVLLVTRDTATQQQCCLP